MDDFKVSDLVISPLPSEEIVAEAPKQDIPKLRLDPPEVEDTFSKMAQIQYGQKVIVDPRKTVLIQNITTEPLKANGHREIATSNAFMTSQDLMKMLSVRRPIEARPIKPNEPPTDASERFGEFFIETKRRKK